MNDKNDTNDGPADNAGWIDRNSFGLPVGAPNSREELKSFLKERGVKFHHNAKNLELMELYMDLPEEPEEPEETGNIPPCPAEDPQAGDKTPAVVAWWHQYKPQEAAVKYAGRKFQPVTPTSHE